MTAPGTGLAVRELAQKFLDGVEAHYQAAGVDLPDRRYIAPGSPEEVAWDCEQLVVSLAGIGWGHAPDAAPTSPQMATQTSVFSMRHAALSIALVRCTPQAGRNGNPPSPAALHAAGERFMRDAGLLSQALVVICSELRQGLDRAALVQPGIVAPAGPQGGYHALESSVTITAGDLV